MRNRVDGALTAASVAAAVALVAAFVAGLLGRSEAPPAAPAPGAVEAEPAGADPDEAARTREPDDAASGADAPGRRAGGAPEPREALDPRGSLADPAAAFQGTAKVEVLNGAGRAGFARDATVRLRALGHDVVAYGNADRFDVERSVVYDRGGPAGAARAVADALGIAAVEVRPDPDLALDATVILGADWALPPPPPERPGGLRGFFRRLFGSRAARPATASGDGDGGP